MLKNRKSQIPGGGIAIATKAAIFINIPPWIVSNPLWEAWPLQHLE
jgi:hypothetical protein